MTIGQQVRAQREALGLTQRQLSVLADMDASNVSQIETGAITPETRTVVKLAHALECTPNDLLGFETAAAAKAG
jgi:transcriptional regulator with XRE-family HTH domain